jgi:hypothetical protein
MCDFDEAAAIAALSCRHQEQLEMQHIANAQIESLKIDFGDRVEEDVIVTLFRECGGDIDSARLLLCDMFPPTERSGIQHCSLSFDPRKHNFQCQRRYWNLLMQSMLVLWPHLHLLHCHCLRACYGCM